MPAASWPSVNGTFQGSVPAGHSMMWRSEWQRPAAVGLQEHLAGAGLGNRDISQLGRLPATATSWTARTVQPSTPAGGQHVGELDPRGGTPGGHVLGRDPVLGRLVRAQDPPRDRLPMYLVRPVDEAGVARVAVQHLEWHVGRVAEATMQLQRPVDDVVQDLGAEDLDHRDVGARRARAELVDLPGGVQRHQAGGLHLRGRVGDPALRGLLVLQQPSPHGSVERPLAHHVEGTPRHPEPPHAVMDPAGDEPVLRDQEALALLAEQCSGPSRTLR